MCASFSFHSTLFFYHQRQSQLLGTPHTHTHTTACGPLSAAYWIRSTKTRDRKYVRTQRTTEEKLKYPRSANTHTLAHARHCKTMRPTKTANWARLRRRFSFSRLLLCFVYRTHLPVCVPFLFFVHTFFSCTVTWLSLWRFINFVVRQAAAVHNFIRDLLTFVSRCIAIFRKTPPIKTAPESMHIVRPMYLIKLISHRWVGNVPLHIQSEPSKMNTNERWVFLALNASMRRSESKEFLFLDATSA